MDDGAKTGLWAQGWTILDDDGFIGYVGPLGSDGGGTARIRHRGPRKHRNRRAGEGGLRLPLGIALRHDRTLIRLRASRHIQMDVHFIDAARIGDLIVSRPPMTAAPRSLIS